MSGPFETEQQVRELPAVQAIYRAFRADPGPGRMAPHTHQMLIGACVAASVELGAFDRRILLWMSGWEPETCAVIAGLISRAHDAGVARAGASPHADKLAALADSIEQRLDNENADRQAIAEDVAAQLRQLSAGMGGA